MTHWKTLSLGPEQPPKRDRQILGSTRLLKRSVSTTYDQSPFQIERHEYKPGPVFPVIFQWKSKIDICTSQYQTI